MSLPPSRWSPPISQHQWPRICQTSILLTGLSLFITGQVSPSSKQSSFYTVLYVLGFLVIRVKSGHWKTYVETTAKHKKLKCYTISSTTPKIITVPGLVYFLSHSFVLCIQMHFYTIRMDWLIIWYPNFFTQYDIVSIFQLITHT